MSGCGTGSPLRRRPRRTDERRRPLGRRRRGGRDWRIARYTRACESEPRSSERRRPHGARPASASCRLRNSSRATISAVGSKGSAMAGPDPSGSAASSRESASATRAGPLKGVELSSAGRRARPDSSAGRDRRTVTLRMTIDLLERRTRLLFRRYTASVRPVSDQTMSYKIDLSALQREGEVSLTQQLVDRFADAIEAGELEPGEKLPPTRELAAEAGVNHLTAARVYRKLAELGYVSASVGRGTFVRALAPAGSH